MKLRRLAASAALGLLVLGLIPACHDTPSDLRVWRPSDHDQPELSQAAAQGASADPDGGSARPGLPPGINQVVLVAWKQNCTRCHGTFGKGDGPEGPMVGARNLSDPTWQKSVSDAQIAQAIQKGVGRMPHFDFPASTLQGLVRLVRLMNADAPRPGAQAGPAASASSAPTRSATRDPTQSKSQKRMAASKAAGKRP